MSIRRFVATSLFILLITHAQGQVPGIINYQGRVVVNGTNFMGTGLFKFALVDGGDVIARRATAVAHRTGAVVTSYQITDGGAGYVSGPNVAVTGGGGSGAIATAQISGGAVTNILVVQGGGGYTTDPTVTIDPPPPSYQTFWSNDGTASGEPATAVSVTVSKGLYSVLLGQSPMTPIPSAVFMNTDVRLRVWFNGGSGMQQLSPDQRIGAVGYALLAADVPDGSIGAPELTSDPASLQKVSAGAITVSGGNVGFGTAVPRSKIDLGSGEGAKLRLYEDGGSDNKVGFGVDMSGSVYENSIYFGANANGHLSVGSWDGTNFSEKARLNQNGLTITGSVTIGGSTSPAPAAGTIRWTGTDFQGYNGGQWVSLSAPTPAGMTLVPGGTFIMGSTALGLYDAQWWPTATNFYREHQVTLDPFYISKYEVTYGVWYSVRQYAMTNGYNFQNAGREGKTGVIGAAPTSASGEPVTTISWRDCIVWCNARSEKEGLVPVYTFTNGAIRDSRDANAAACDGAVFNTGNNGYRLPTEAEWECASRCLDGQSWTPGDYASGSGFNWSNTVANAEVAWHFENSSNRTHTVGTKKPNQIGLYDMSGNICEWCWDWAADYSTNAVTNPVGPTSSPWNLRIMRGGSCNYGAPGYCCSYRINYEPSRANNDETGFRCVRNAQ